MAEENEFKTRQNAFVGAESLERAMQVVWNRSNDDSNAGRSGMFQHYTTLGRVLEKNITRRWYLTRGDSLKLNDLKEARKYGVSNKELMRRTYIMCFGNGAGENVAMWGLYSNKNPLAIRLSISRQSVYKWMNDLMVDKNIVIKDESGNIVKRSKIKHSLFRDMVYVAVQDKDKDAVDEYDIWRTNIISWNGTKHKFDNKYDLGNEIRNELYAGWLKDFEWCHERESRLCIQLKKTVEDEVLSVSIPDYVLCDMRFTLSPWIESRKMFDSIVETLATSLRSAGMAIDDCKQRFRRSVLEGALNFPS